MYKLRNWMVGILSLCTLMLVGCENEQESVSGSAQTESIASQEVQVKQTYVEFKTNQGSFVVELDAQKAPITVENFLGYVKSNFYDNTIFHRVIPNFMVQGGGFTTDFTQKPTRPPIQNEANNGLRNLRGTIAMARTMDPNSASAQFFINLVDNDFLDYRSSTQNGWGYAVFGKVVKGMDVVDKIAKQKTGNRAGHENVPVENVIIESVKEVPAAQVEEPKTDAAS